jgi:hypothetical protein
VTKLIALLKSPLTHFSVMGFLLYVIYFLMNPSLNGATAEAYTIEVSATHIRYLEDRFEQRMMRRPTVQEVEDMIDQHVRDEIYYREALRLGLGGDDSLIRRRMRQKLDFILLDTAELIAPDHAELQQYMLQHAARYMAPAQVSFHQVYLGQVSGFDYENIVAQLNDGSFEAIPPRGLMLQDSYQAIPLEVVDRRFGANFAEMLVKLPTGSWQAPIQSGFGAHAVRLVEYEPPGLPNLEAQYDGVLQDWLADKTTHMKEEIYRDISRNYEIVIESPEIELTLSGMVE